MMVLYVGAGLIALALVATVLLLVANSSGPTGVAKSLTLIDQSVGERQVVRVELDAKDRLVAPFWTERGVWPSPSRPRGRRIALQACWIEQGTRDRGLPRGSWGPRGRP